MDSSYTMIANALSEACPATYSKAWIEAEVEDDWDKQRIWCEDDVGKSQPRLDARTSFIIGGELRQVRKSMTIPGQEPWSRCTFTLFPDGKFKFDVEDDD